jgi:hypothetical protein
MMNWTPWQQLYEHAEMKPWHWGIIVLSAGTAIWLIFRIRAYFREDAEDADQTLEMLTQFRDLHQEGGLSDDEFRLIRSRLAHTAQEALVAGKAKSSAVSAELGPSNSLGPKRAISNELTAINTTEDDVKSARMTDEETE